ncbi:hypothetical protein EBQ26_03385 [Allofranklinella schreckenbergeri]|uniref:ABC-type transport auxiliary lipoprotein component domain-containing protein n=1 Tax=Allofranklinella schreckenbergeri TaxID=1076744 RepID=A0A3M6QAP1_9BURK|nr:ABC-type transport auxiliary lipoprotein family protein [Allofranklinella schreckenbergeri]RMX00120.1 hypothetical protein EBQ26_03385 [Allofranklinella schreckenbergeri]
MMHRLSSLLVAASAALALAGCATLPEPPSPTVLYDFGAAAPAQPAAQPASQTSSQAPNQPPSLLLASVSASGLPTDSQVMLYRLAYADDLQLRGYQNARWSQPVQRLFEQQLRQQLERTRVVLDADFSPARLREDGIAPPVLRADVERFEQVFPSDSASGAIVRVRATVVRSSAQGDQVLGQRVFERSANAASADASGGAQAMAQAARQVAADIDAWLAQLK